MAARPVPVRGMRDLLPGQVRHREHVRAGLEAIYRSYGYEPIETPALEAIDRLTSGEGGENEGLIYRVLRRDLRDLSDVGDLRDLADLGLRYDLTVPLTRYYATNSAQLADPFRSLQIGPVWRAERPQRGRYRQFIQCDIDVLGEATIGAEVELLSATCDALRATGLSGFTVRVNDRRVLEALVVGSGFPADLTRQVLITLDKLDKVGAEGVAEQLAPLGHAQAAARLMDVLADEKAGVGALAAVLRGALPDDAVEAVDTIMTAVSDQRLDGVDVAFDATLVRGMGYYTGPIFEVAHVGSPGSIAGGGRYDRLVAKSGGADVPACGMSIGFERLCDLLTPDEQAPGRRVVVLHDPGAPLGPLLRAARDLRADGYTVTRATRAGRPGKQLPRLAAQGHDLLWDYDPATPTPTLRPLT